MPPTSGPRGDAWPGTARVTAASVPPRSTLRQVVSRSSASATAEPRSGAAKSSRSRTLCTSVPTRAPPGHVGQAECDRTRPVGQERRRHPSSTAGARTSSSEVKRCSGSLPMAGWSWAAAVMPSRRLVATRCRACGRSARPRGSGGAPRSTCQCTARRWSHRSTATRWAEGAGGRLDLLVDCAPWPRTVGRAHRGRGRRAGGPAANAGCPWRRPTTRRPGGRPGSARRRAGEGPRPVPPRARASGAC